MQTPSPTPALLHMFWTPALMGHAAWQDTRSTAISEPPVDHQRRSSITTSPHARPPPLLHYPRRWLSHVSPSLCTPRLAHPSSPPRLAHPYVSAVPDAPRSFNKHPPPTPPPPNRDPVVTPAAARLTAPNFARRTITFTHCGSKTLCRATLLPRQRAKPRPSIAVPVTTTYITRPVHPLVWYTSVASADIIHAPLLHSPRPTH